MNMVLWKNILFLPTKNFKLLMKEVIKMKNVLKRTIAMMSAVITMAIMCCFTVTSASAAEITPLNPVASVSATATISAPMSPIAAFSLKNTAAISVPNLKMNQGQGQGQNGGMAHGSEDAAFQNVVDFIVKWVKRAGLLIGFFGAISILLAMKNDDADGKQRGIMTFIAGFGAAAVCQCVGMFNIFS